MYSCQRRAVSASLYRRRAEVASLHLSMDKGSERDDRNQVNNSDPRKEKGHTLLFRPVPPLPPHTLISTVILYCKKNIQPLFSGRTARRLSIAEHPHPSDLGRVIFSRKPQKMLPVIPGCHFSLSFLVVTPGYPRRGVGGHFDRRVRKLGKCYRNRAVVLIGVRGAPSLKVSRSPSLPVTPARFSRFRELPQAGIAL